MPRIILASQSPRRRQLLEQIGLRDFQVLALETEESYDPSLPPDRIVAVLSRRKAEAAAQIAGLDTLIIAADTMVFLDSLRLGKPSSEADAFSMLSALSGRTHYVRTGVTVYANGQSDTQVETTAVTFRQLTDREIRGYIRTGEPADKAGAYGIQGPAALFVSAIQGDYSNVMGLPLCLLGRMLAAQKIDLFAGEAET